MEERVFEEVTDFVYEVPIPFIELAQNGTVSLGKNLQMGLRKTGAAEESLEENLVLPLQN